MRILQICSAREIGGGERHLADLTNSLAERGHAMFAALVPRSPLRGELLSVPNENVIELPMRNALSLRSSMKLSRHVRSQSIEIVHAHVARDYPSAALIAGRSGAKLVLTRHVLFSLNPIHKLTLRRTSRVIAVSNAVANALRAQNIFSPDRISVVHNGVNVERFEQRREAPDEIDTKSRLRVGTIGHLAPIKGHDDFIRAAAIVCRLRDDVEFLIAGEDKSPAGENRKAFEKLIRDLGVEERVRLIGWVEDVATLLGTLDVFVSPAKAEPFGLSIVEAMAAGVPVIATRSEGAQEILEDNHSGRLVSIGDVESLASAIMQLLDDRAERLRLADNARRAARQHFSLERMVDKTEQVYREVLENRDNFAVASR